MDGLRAVPGVKITGPVSMNERLPGHVSFVAAGFEGEALVLKLDLKGLMVSSASACHRGIIEPSHVVMATGVARDEAAGSVRMSAGRFNTEDECKQAVQILAGFFSAMRAANALKQP